MDGNVRYWEVSEEEVEQLAAVPRYPPSAEPVVQSLLEPARGFGLFGGVGVWIRGPDISHLLGKTEEVVV